MRFLGLGLQGKFVVALLVSTALPFLIALAVFETSSYRYLLEERGRYHHMEAVHLAQSLNEAADGHGGMCQLWLAAEPALMEHLDRKNREASLITGEVRAHKTRLLEQEWPALEPDDARLLEALRNEGARSLIRYRELNPEIAEILATDIHGCLIAATGKTTDYEQADESWWQHASILDVHARWMDALRLDASSGVFSQDIVMPLHQNGTFAGVLKISVDVTSIFTRLATQMGHGGERWQIVLDDGEILASSEKGYSPLTERIPEPLRRDIRQNNKGWTLTQDSMGEGWLTGFAALDDGAPAESAHILFSTRRDEVVAPLQDRFLQVGSLALFFITLCALTGYWLIHYQVLRPLDSLRRAARSISTTVGIRPQSSPDDLATSNRGDDPVLNLDAIRAIRTGDEIEPLARDFAEMTERLLSYHHDMETDTGAEKRHHARGA